MTTSYKPEPAAGSLLTGKWKGRPYRVLGKLGEGANGAVYLVSGGGRRFALKIGLDAADVQSEVNALTAITSGAGPLAGFLVDTDDFVWRGTSYSFYVMKYVEGKQSSQFLDKEGPEWLGVIGLKLLAQLAHLHERGWVFGDLKTENVLVSAYGDAHLVDFGGLSPIGRSVKQFTEIYDRSYWNAGTRTADPGYDLFSFGVLCLRLLNAGGECFRPGLLPQNRSPELLLRAAETTPSCRPYLPCLRRLLTGGYSSSREAFEDWRAGIYSRYARPRGSGGALGFGFKTGIAVSAILFLSVVYLYIRDLL
ncbi:protein kinase domain-containing protein [Gorillibacterium sp. sgz500922]|uniref:protein kinase domain-containing protein n=1 Tax=Gorillibacterium sp. sgz500922 TaxID=3446694 RepID=UPI003F677093